MLGIQWVLNKDNSPHAFAFPHLFASEDPCYSIFFWEDALTWAVPDPSFFPSVPLSLH